jgi:ketosteroid isomerase-like protein
MKALLAMILCCVAASAHAAGVALDAGVGAAIHQFIDSFDKGDVKAAEATHAADPTIVDEVPPYRWQGRGAFKTWLGDLTKHDTAAGVTDGNVKLGEAIRQEIDGDHAYVVMAAEYTFKQKGMPMKAAAQMTFALAKGKGGWRIAGWTYSAPRAAPAQ